MPKRPGKYLRSSAPLAVAICVLAAPVAAQESTADSLAAQLRQLLERVEQLEQRNQELERRVEEMSKPAVSPGAPAAQAGAAPVPPPAPQEARLEQVEREQQSLRERLLSLTPPTPIDIGGDGPSFEVGLVGAVQSVNSDGSDDGEQSTRLNYRGDVLVTLPAGSIKDARGTLVGHLRFGQGGGVALVPTYTSTPNTTTFEAAAGSDQTYAVVAQAYYHLDWPLDAGRFNDLARDRVELTIGKLDFFAFFDQNAVAGDEAAQFLNNAFVHNPLLDSGGDIGADQYGFAPGARVGYFREGERRGWGAWLGVFAAGDAATFNEDLDGPLVILQGDYVSKQINGEPRGTYRAYVWTNGSAADLDGSKQDHTGFGLSVDQRVGREWNLFGRFGQRLDGDGTFNTALTLGFEHGGRLWGRARDAVGLALGWLETSDAWRDATADPTLVGYEASGGEYIAELYYRWTLNANVEIAPDFQVIQNPGGNRDADTAYVVGVRGGVRF
jgi:uncharacterized coiled-coil protein SlyX